MPHAELPTSLLGWLAAVTAGVVGFLAGFVVLAVFERVIG